jgi:hypothetical protein
MKSRRWILIGMFVALGIVYVVFFTEWLRPAPIEIASQVRFSIQPPRFGRPPKPAAKGNTNAPSHQPPATNQVKFVDPYERIGQPEKGRLDPAPGGVANVTFSLDGWYHLTSIRVEDVPADGSKPQVLWQLVGKSRLVNSLLYGHDPEGMRPLLQGANLEPLQAGVPYRLIIHSGRRSGTNNFRTVELRAAE